jgi:hypothetical protein
MWSWLTAIIKGIFAALFDKVVEEAKQPKTIEYADTPNDLKAAVDADVARQLDRLRREAGGDSHAE